ncbi:prolyl-tRNA editing protein [Halobacteriales archaeon QS_1_68_17]|nr:MAG: prolyl-tRNA editing protein [Halobacteriales archaeon QS_1_68_17]
MHPRATEFAERARAELGFDPGVREFPDGTSTAADAAEAIGCSVGQIASAIAMAAGGDLVVVLTSGANRVSEPRLAELWGVPAGEVRTADADEITERLGWSIGGVPPFCHDEQVPVYMDETLTAFDEVWAAAGTPEAVFPIAPDRLRELAGAEPVAIAE